MRIIISFASCGSYEIFAITSNTREREYVVNVTVVIIIRRNDSLQIPQ